MLEGLFKFIAKHTFNYFQSQDTSGTVNPGERYCLTLENSLFVSRVYDELKDYASSLKMRNDYTYYNELGNAVYHTYTVRYQNTEILVAAKDDNTTDDFLTTLRNADLRNAQGERMPILMIVYSPIDSILHGTGDLKAKGMPFHFDNIVNEIESCIANNSLILADKILLSWELDNMKSDRFSDNTSLSAYGDILAVLFEGQLKGDDFPKFGLLEDDELNGFSSDENEIRIRLDENRDVFKKIDFIVKHGDVDVDLSKEYDDSFIKAIEKNKKDGKDWYDSLTFKDARKSKEKKNKKENNPLRFDYDGISVYVDGDDSANFILGKDIIVRPDDDKSREFVENIIIFNPENHDELKFRVPSNKYVFDKYIQKNLCLCDNVVSLNKQSHYGLEATLKAEGCSYYKIVLNDENNKKFQIKICVLNIPSVYLGDIKTKFVIDDLNKRSKDSCIRVNEVPALVSFNDFPGCFQKINIDFTEGAVYTCSYNENLIIHFNADGSWCNDSNVYKCHVKFGAVDILFKFLDEGKKKATELTGKTALLKKYSLRKSMEFKSLEDGKVRISFGGEGYFAKRDFALKLNLENSFINEEWFAAEKVGDIYKSRDIEIDSDVKTAYLALLQSYRTVNTLPSLAFYSGEIRDVALRYVNAVMDALNAIPDKKSLSPQSEGLMALGCVFENGNEPIIEMSPLHPLNICYQLRLTDEVDVDQVRDDLITRLTPLYLLPYIQEDTIPYHAIEQVVAPEWRVYARMENKRYHGARSFVKNLVCDKIFQYKDNFEYMFDDISNDKFCINLINMGDCREIFQGIIRYFVKAFKSCHDVEKLLRFTINIYEDFQGENDFSVLGNGKRLKDYIHENVNLKDFDLSENELAIILADRIKCFIRAKTINTEFEYAHLAFYEMGSTSKVNRGSMELISTGMSLDGLVSGVPSVFDTGWYKTGFGTKYSNVKNNTLIELAVKYNSVYAILGTSSDYDAANGMFTEIEKDQEKILDKIYDSSNWVVFIDPKVDLSFFNETDDKDLMIIHYSDQYTSSSGYDDITVTRKSKQYLDIIGEQLKKKGISAGVNNCRAKELIRLFNAVNGSWLLKLITANVKKGDTNFTREKMSILSAVKVAMAYFYHKDIVWVPISLEELLRVSGGTGLTQRDGIFSASKLGFSGGPTCDDLLLVGIQGPVNDIRVYLHPIEVKIGINHESVITKASKQLENTYEGFKTALCYDEEHITLQDKIVRSFFMQLVIVSCEKMKLYEVYPEMNWDLILNDFRECLLNEKYRFVENLGTYDKHGTIISFKKDIANASISNESRYIDRLELSETCGYQYMVSSISDICDDFDSDELRKFRLNNTFDPRRDMIVFHREDIRDYNYSINSKDEETDIKECKVAEKNESYNEDEFKSEKTENKTETEFFDDNVDPVVEKGMHIKLGTDKTTGTDIIWEPNNTDKVFHTNTGIIGVMGTGKTQFTQSLVTQLNKEAKTKNIGNDKLGILIFDYKGDYNHTKENFTKANDTKVFKPYHLPFNPFALPESNKPLLPLHVANSFGATVSKIYGLGPKQKNALQQCILKAYASRGISKSDSSTWKLSAPTFADVYEIYMEDEEIKKGDSLAAMMDKLSEFEIFEADPHATQTLYDLLEGVVVIDINDYDSDIQSLVVAITLDQFYSQMKSSGSSILDGKYRQMTKFILVDEADNFMSQGFPALDDILKQGREFGVGVILSTQLLGHFCTGEDNYSKYINTWIVHNVADLNDSDISFVFQTEKKSPKSLQLFNDIKKLEKFNSIVKIGTGNPVYSEDLPFWKLFETL